MRPSFSCVVVCLALPAFAQTTNTWLYEVGDETIGERSGDKGSKTALVKVADGPMSSSSDWNFNIGSVRFMEQSDRPCFIRITKEHSLSAAPVTSDFDVCKGNEGGTQDLRHDGGGQRFSGLQVCLNKQKDRIKGLRLFISEYSTSSQEAGVHKLERKKKEVREFARPNCDEKDGWADPSRCDEGAVLTGFKVFYRTGEGVGDTSDIITGLAPICRPYTVRVIKKTTGGGQ